VPTACSSHEGISIQLALLDHGTVRAAVDAIWVSPHVSQLHSLSGDHSGSKYYDLYQGRSVPKIQNEAMYRLCASTSDVSNRGLGIAFVVNR